MAADTRRVEISMQRNPLFEMLEEKGIFFEGAVEELPNAARKDYSRVAMDAQPQMLTDANAGLPAILTTHIDPEVVRIATTPLKIAGMITEVQKGSWTDDTMMFQVIEGTGEVSTYGDRNQNGRSGVNISYPNRQAYRFQTHNIYGDLEVKKAGLAVAGYVNELRASAVARLNNYSNLTYLYGVSGMQNYGILNSPGLPAALTPATKGAGGVKWINNGTVIATPNEVFTDVNVLITQLIVQSGSIIDTDTPMTLALPSTLMPALMNPNSFGYSGLVLLKQNYPNLKVEQIPQYGQIGINNTQGFIAGNIIQVIADTVDGVKTVYGAYSVKLMAFPIVREASASIQKFAQSTWGAIVRRPWAIAAMVGV